MKIIIASNNKGKIKEIKELIGSGYEVVSLSEAGFFEDIEENGSSFEENAMIKAEAVAKRFPDCAVMADDSGLCVSALNGAPGIYSARYSGVHGDDKANNEKLLSELSGRSDRSAYFMCAVACTLPSGERFTVTGKCDGIIAEKESGENGFGYDPLFYLEEYKKTMAEISFEEKNRISHRAKALNEFVKELRKRVSI